MKKPITLRIPNGNKTVAHCRHKIKIPKLASFHLEGRNLIGVLSCGHRKVLFRIPEKRSTCYKCQGEEVRWNEDVTMYREVVWNPDKAIVQ